MGVNVVEVIVLIIVLLAIVGVLVVVLSALCPPECCRKWPEQQPLLAENTTPTRGEQAIAQDSVAQDDGNMARATAVVINVGRLQARWMSGGDAVPSTGLR